MALMEGAPEKLDEMIPQPVRADREMDSEGLGWREREAGADSAGKPRGGGIDGGKSVRCGVTI